MGEHWFLVFLCAFAARVIFLVLVMSQVGSEATLTICPDASSYLQAATEIREKWNFDTYGVDTFGPGYPVFLALLQIFSGGGHPVILMLLHILTGAIGSVLMYLWAERLTGDRNIALVAGLLNAFSFTSVSLANILLSETAYFVVTLLGLLLFHKAGSTGRRRYYVWAGAVLAGAALIRTMGQFLFALLPFLAVFLFPKDSQRWRRIGWSFVTAAVMVLLMSLWSVHYYRKHQVFGIASSSSGGLTQMVRLTYARVENTTDYWARVWSDSLVCARDSAVGDYCRTLDTFARERLGQYLGEKPGAVLSAFAGSLWHNVNYEPGVQEVQLPLWKGTISRFWASLVEYKLNYRATALAALGAVFLLLRRRIRLLLTLLLIYGYFATLSAFSVWQTNRIFYPGQIAWAVMGAVPIAALFDWIAGRFAKRRGAATAAETAGTAGR